MKQSILKHGDLVRYHIRDYRLEDMGFKIGQFYPVEAYETPEGDKLLLVSVAKGMTGVNLVEDGELTEYADHFTKHRCPVTLPIGQLQKRGL